MTKHTPPLAARVEKKAKGRGEGVASTLLIAAFSGSFVVFFVGMLATTDAMFSWGLAAFTVSSLAVDIFFAWYPVDADVDAAAERRRRRLALTETLALAGWVVVAWIASDGQTILFVIVCAGGGGPIIALFHVLRSRLSPGEASPQPLAEAPEEVSPQQAERFWAERKVRVIWFLLSLLECGGFFGALLAGVLLAGGTIAGALGVACLVFAPIALLSWALHRRYEIPLMTTMPARPQPEVQDVRETVVYRASMFNAALVFLAPAFVFVMFGAIIVSLGRGGPEPSFGNGTAALVIGATVAGVACALAAAIRVRRMRLEIGPEGLRVVNFFRGAFLTWDEIAHVETAALWWLEGASIVLAAVEQEVPAVRGVRVRLKDVHAWPLRVSVVNFGDPHRDARLQRALVALRREGEAHGVAVGI
jgi:hypothetical protein